MNSVALFLILCLSSEENFTFILTVFSVRELLLGFIDKTAMSSFHSLYGKPVKYADPPLPKWQRVFNVNTSIITVMIN